MPGLRQHLQLTFYDANRYFPSEVILEFVVFSDVERAEAVAEICSGQSSPFLHCDDGVIRCWRCTLRRSVGREALVFLVHSLFPSPLGVLRNLTARAQLSIQVPHTHTPIEVVKFFSPNILVRHRRKRGTCLILLLYSTRPKTKWKATREGVP